MLRGLADDLIALVLPTKCPGCGRRAEPVCDACARSMRPAPPGRPILGVTWAASVFAYEGVARELIARVKYRNERAAVRWLAAHVAQRCALAPGFDVITWVPASATRRATRGVDHGALLARSVGDALAVAPECLLVRDAGPAQTGRPIAERRAGPRLHATGSIVGRRVLVVDDVETTGATLTAAAATLHAAGARDVYVATIARTPKPSERRRTAAYTPATQSRRSLPRDARA